ncbi:anti-sigma factor antagonist [uncultured Parolsenella sp.]|uniref:anti-sigma factor antagonist n=1 Tax=uncultured Parolsenella sp. TaxID=2083008 RepID=UPI0025DEC03B|nr:anti-sigma factor antagonist [uncultured Parolsenella sp.]
MTSTGDILLLPVRGDLDVASVPRVRAYLDRAIDGGCRRVILSLADTDYVDSLGMALILAYARRLAEKGGLLSLVNVGDNVYRSLAICRLVDFIPVMGRAPKPPVPALDPSVRPLWHGTMRVDEAHLSAARRRLEQLLSRTDLTNDEVFDLTLAGGEALGNAVDHTCAEGVLLTVWVYPDRAVVEVTDCGSGFELDEDGEVPQGEGGDCLERGRGIKLMRMLSDSVEICRKPSGTGTVVRLVKLFTPMAATV